ncbi:putative neutral sphingomyelinase [Cephus cinctus]|uniref:sphingomyelin phosphodiesterase n=1 Tax=Cephus cinctus TaxID=211228 RepID=A0AAJ7BXG3_CEPCN|nr:putative neutral sphingomyelinase [Cephus cinctus]
MTDATSIRLLTLNCWGIPYISKNRSARMNAIAEKLADGEYDIVCLQEVWSVDDFKMLKAKAQECLPYSHYFYSGVLGSGICILSRYQIQDVMFHRWPLNGYVHKIHHGDWFGGKGIGLCRLKIKNIKVNIYVAHLHAEYDRENDEYTAHRVLQAFDTAQFIRMTKGGSDVVILGGDLNTEPQDLAYRIICGIGELTDACTNSSCFNQGTNECATNSYTGSNFARKKPEGHRIDHILYLGSSRYKVEVTDFKQPFPNRVPGKNFSYSDHEAIAATLKMTKGHYEVQEVDVRDSLKEALVICEAALVSIHRRRMWYLLLSLFLLILLILPLLLHLLLDQNSIAVTIALNVLRFLLTAVLCYTLFMSSIWNNVEKNSLKAGYLAMEMHLVQLNRNLANT